uniref:NADH-ubiquinone oxidoreductase chain 6 n=1 Tax=Pselaphinae sp. 10 EF-2015 TaxID=1756854 RepID=A0A0S2M8X5_9COLE|nr:NADH deshydrogenase subunit 6 [Pselaphinae sp. 10 EF-2015]
MSLIITLNMTLMIMFMFLKHPLSMGMALLIQTLIISIITSMMNNLSWFSYVLFLIFIGGMLILFMYMINVASNEIINISKKMFLFTLIMPVCMYMIKYMINMNNYENLIYIFKLNLLLNKYYEFPNMIIMIMLIFYLLLTLIACVKIINLKYGPMRSK